MISINHLKQIFKNHISSRRRPPAEPGNTYEYCPNCDANLTLQKGYDSSLPYWICKGCGQMLINPAIESDISWICDKCGAMLNIQDGFDDHGDVWKCTECGFENTIDKSEIYLSEDEYQASLKDPYKGIADEDMIEILKFAEVGLINDREDLMIVAATEADDQMLYVKKLLSTYDVSVYRYLMEHPIAHMPKLIGVYEGDNRLVIIEEYIKGITLSELIDKNGLSEKAAIRIAKDICHILTDLHGLDNPIIHRDIKPSNVIISESGETYLLDINVAKWYKPEEAEDTKLLGTLYYAAPEQFGYGYSASSAKSDIYALGILLNVMITGRIPKEEKAIGPVWSIIEKCTRMEPEERYSAQELLAALESL